MKALKTSDIARAVGLHPNMIRLYEAWGWLPTIPRGKNGYRLYSEAHLEQVQLIRLALEFPFLGDKALLIALVRRAAEGDPGMAMELAYRYLATVRVERTHAEAALEFLERWAAGQLLETPRPQVHIGKAAAHLNLSVETLRNWERNGLLTVPRDPANGYRLYGTLEFGRLRVIRTLVQARYSQMAILRMLLLLDKGSAPDLRAALDTPRADEEAYTVTDHWLTTLMALETRAQAMIRHIGRMIERAHRESAKPSNISLPP